MLLDAIRRKTRRIVRRVISLAVGAVFKEDAVRLMAAKEGRGLGLVGIG
jgi:hypothetical protein